MNSDREFFLNLPIRCRVAFGICCLENALLHFGHSLEEWWIVLKQLWRFTELEKHLDEWMYSTAEYLPESVLDKRPFHKKGNEYVTPQLEAQLTKLYETASPLIGEIIDAVFTIGTTHMYETITDGGERSLQPTLAIVQLMHSQQVPLPDHNIFQRFKGGNSWGKTFSKQDLA